MLSLVSRGERCTERESKERGRRKQDRQDRQDWGGERDGEEKDGEEMWMETYRQGKGGRYRVGEEELT